MVGGCDKKEGERLSKRDWTSKALVAQNKASTALLTYARPKTSLCDAALPRSIIKPRPNVPVQYDLYHIL